MPRDEVPKEVREGRQHTTGEGETKPRRLMRSGAKDVPAGSTPGAMDPEGEPRRPAAVGLDDDEA